MTYLMSAILGLVQGVAEFLPISSSGHLTLLQHFFGMEEPDQLFNILLHFATLLAVCIYYFQDVLGMILEFFRGIAVFVSFALLVTGCILFLSDRMATGRKTARSATVKDVLLVGVAQGIATIPGLSRSGCTISAGMALGFRREFAVRYSFLMSLPAVFGATLLEVKDTLSAGAGIPDGMLGKYLLGMVIAGVVGYFAIRLVNLLADKGKFGAFAYYCWIAGAIFLVLSLLGVTFVHA